MKTRIVILAVILFGMPHSLLAQSVQLGISSGFASYLGDLQNKQFAIRVTDPSFGMSVRYELQKKVALRAGFTAARISAYDKNNSSLLQPRNLSFITNINELSLLMEYSFFDLRKYQLSPYVFFGAAGYHFNPYSYDYDGRKVMLKPLKTEGQGLPQYKDRKPYSLFQFAIPMGGGLRVALSDDAMLGFELGFRRLFTDYLDDVSADYVDEAVLLNLVGPKSIEMSYRGGEVNPYNLVGYPAEGTPRGNSRFNDWYSFYNLTYTINLSRVMDINDQKGRVACPRRF